MKKIGILVIATRGYNDFINPLFTSIATNFLPEHRIGLMLFTDAPYSQIYNFKEHTAKNCNNRVHVSAFEVTHKPWPYMTLHRYNIFNKHKEHLKNFDYLYYIDADMKVESIIDEEVLPDNPNQIVAVKHPGYYQGGGDWETSMSSVAFVSPAQRKTYWAGGFNGASSAKYLSMCQEISTMLALDECVNIIAKWHDESYFNRYLIDQEVKTLDSGYIYPEDSEHIKWNLPFKKRIIALNKNHSELRKED